MTSNKIFIIAEKLFVAEDNKIKFIINSIYKKRLEIFLNSFKGDDLKILSNIPNLKSKHLKNQVSLDKNAYKYKNSFNFKILHDYILNLNNIVENSKLKHFLIFKGIHVIKVLEPRLLDNLFNGVLWKLDFYIDQLNKKPKKIYLFDFNLVEKSLKAVIKHKELKYKIGDYIIYFVICILKYFLVTSIRNNKFYDDTWLGKSLNPKLQMWNQKKNRKRILIIGTIDRTAVRVLDLLPQMNEQNYEVYFLALKRITLKDELEKNGVKFAFAGDFKSKETSPFKNFNVNLKKILRNEIYKNKTYFSFKCIDFSSDIFNTVLKILNDYKMRAIDAIDIANNTIDKCCPDLILSFEENELPRAFNYVSKQKNINFLNAIHLSPAWYPGLIRREYKNIFVSGNILKKLFQPWNKKSKISIVGDPIHDNFNKKKNRFNHKEFRNKHFIPGNKGLIGLFSTWPDDSTVDIYEIKKLFFNANKIAKKFDKTLLIRPHPLQEIDLIEKWLRDWKCEGYIIKNTDILDFSIASEIIFLTATTAVWYPMIIGTPVVTFQKIPPDLDKSLYGLGFNQNKGIFYIDDVNKKQNEIKKLFDKNSKFRKTLFKKANKHVKEHVGELNMESSKIFISKIKQLIFSDK